MSFGAAIYIPALIAMPILLPVAATLVLIAAGAEYQSFATGLP